jgi:hypothetical protein
MAKADGEQGKDRGQLFLPNASILVGATLIAARTPLWVFEILDWCPPNPSDRDILFPPVFPLVLIGTALVGLGWQRRSRLNR